jgi:hypothetical protein
MFISVPIQQDSAEREKTREIVYVYKDGWIPGRFGLFFLGPKKCSRVTLGWFFCTLAWAVHYFVRTAQQLCDTHKQPKRTHKIYLHRLNICQKVTRVIPIQQPIESQRIYFPTMFVLATKFGISTSKLNFLFLSDKIKVANNKFFLSFIGDR